ncbi:MAG: hypothetical protein Q4D57_01360 [Clostridia bacterium]|nr:hypothetical protein [Clostridia bacterium]
MKLKNIWLIFCITFLILVPAKIYSSLSPVEFVESSTFLILFALGALALAICIYLSKFSLKNISIQQNTVLGGIAALIALCFLWCVPAYFGDTVTKYDFEWQPILVTVFSALSFVTFTLISVTHFMGKNIISKAPFFLYCPVLWFGFKMILFLSVNNNTTDPYDVISTGFLTLFMIYFTQTFATSTKANNIKLLFVLGLPLVLFSASSNVPVILKVWTEGAFVSSAVATATLEILLAIYVLFTLITAHKQLENKDQKVIKAF